MQGKSQAMKNENRFDIENTKNFVAIAETTCEWGLFIGGHKNGDVKGMAHWGLNERTATAGIVALIKWMFSLFILEEREEIAEILQMGKEEGNEQ